MLLYHRPLLWMRMAECCIVAHSLHHSKDKQSGSFVRVVGDGTMRRVMLPASGANGPVGRGAGAEEGETKVAGNDVPLSALDASFAAVPILEPPPVGGGAAEGQKVDGDAGGAAGTSTPTSGQLSLQYAVRCLENCRYLLRCEAEAAVSGAAAGGGRAGGLGAKSGGGVLGAAALAANSRTEGKDGDDDEAVAAAMQAKSDAARAANARLERAALAGLAFVSLCMDHPLKALSAANKLLESCAAAGKEEGGGAVKSEGKAGGKAGARAGAHGGDAHWGGGPAGPDDASVNVYRHLGHTYAAESLCALSRVNEALDHALAAMPPPGAAPTKRRGGGAAAGGAGSVGGAGVGAQRAGRSGPSSGPVGSVEKLTLMGGADPETSAWRCAMCVNVGNVRLLQNDMDAARACFDKALSLDPTAEAALRGLVYLLLRSGNTKGALQVIKTRLWYPKQASTTGGPPV